MNEDQLAKFRELIRSRLKAIAQEDALGLSGQATVELDQQAVGRLSRMDAMQNQAMAKAQAGRRKTEKTRLHAALARMERMNSAIAKSAATRLHRDGWNSIPRRPSALVAHPGKPVSLIQPYKTSGSETGRHLRDFNSESPI